MMTRLSLIVLVLVAACGGDAGGVAPDGDTTHRADGSTSSPSDGGILAGDGGSVPASDMALPLPKGAPRVLYTDLVSGPNTGGENGKGVYLSIFGVNFGGSGLSTAVKVFLNGVEVDNYRTLSPSKGRSDIEQITVQLGAIGNPTPGTPLPIKVSVNGVDSNTDHTFTVNPGRILFVDAATGNDSTGAPDDITKPYKTVQSSDLTKAAWGQIKPGDILVLRAGTHSSVGREDYFMRFITSTSSGYKSGTAPTGASATGPITLMGYPGEDAFINGDSATHSGGALSGLNGENYPAAGKWVVIADLRIEGGGYDGPISQEIHGDNWRIVNNELTAKTGVTTGNSPSRMGGITGNGSNAFWLGNHIHDIQGSSGEAHGIYIDGDGSYEIAYNDIHDIKSGNGFQMFSNGGNGSDYINAVKFHHNSIHTVTKHLINIADGTQAGVQIWNNVAWDGPLAALRFNSESMVGCQIYNNTFVDFGKAGNDLYGALTSDANMPAGSLDLRNNIFVPHAGTPYNTGTVGVDASVGKFSNNLYFGGTGSTSFDTTAITADPKLAADHRLTAGSAAIDAGTALSLVSDDFTVLLARPQGGALDIGAYELEK